jgi:tripartite-type tricarboxylate transporter receptor subunit TctC
VHAEAVLREAAIMKRREFFSFAAAAAMLPAASRLAWSQGYPNRPVMIVVPFAAGGPADALARIMGDRMRVALGKQVVIENMVGGGGSVGVGRVVRSAPDGYTVGIGHWTTHVINGAIYDLPNDLVRDLEPVAQLPATPQLVVSKNGVPAKNLNELIAWLKGRKVSAGTAGPGSGSHVAGVLFENLTGTHFTFVPYRGTGPAMNDLIAGQIDLIIDQASNALPQVRAGTVRAYAVTAKARLASAPDIPTVDEAGLPGFYTSVWYGLWVPKGTPRDIIAKLNAAAVAAMADRGVQERMATLGLDIPPRDQQSPEALGALQKAEIEKWWPIVKAAHINAE